MDLMNCWQPPVPQPDSRKMNFNWRQHTFVRGADFNAPPQMEEHLHFPSWFHIQVRCFWLEILLGLKNGEKLTITLNYDVCVECFAEQIWQNSG